MVDDVAVSVETASARVLADGVDASIVVGAVVVSFTPGDDGVQSFAADKFIGNVSVGTGTCHRLDRQALLDFANGGMGTRIEDGARVDTLGFQADLAYGAVGVFDTLRSWQWYAGPVTISGVSK